MLQKLMKVSIFYHHCRMWARQHGCSIDNVLEQVRSLGITHVEADRDEIGNTKDFDALLARHDLLVSSIYGFYEWGRDPSDFHNLLQLDQAQILHSPEVMFVPGLCRFRNPLLRLAERRRMQEGLAAMEDWMREIGVVMHASELGLTEEMFDDVVKGTFLLDGGYKKLAPEDVRAILAESM